MKSLEERVAELEKDLLTLAKSVEKLAENDNDLLQLFF